jgi:hypothetical protein
MPLVRKDPLWIRAGNTIAGELPMPKGPYFHAELFMGISTVSRAILEAGWPFKLTFGVDNRKELKQTLLNLHGPDDGSIKLQNIQDIDFNKVPTPTLATGTSPCQDFTALHDGPGLHGSRGSLFMVQLEAFKNFASRNDGVFCAVICIQNHWRLLVKQLLQTCRVLFLTITRPVAP